MASNNLMDDPYKQLGARLEWIREGRELTRSQVAAALDMSWEGYQSYETGRVRLPIMLVPSLAEIFGYSNLEFLRLLGIVDDDEGAQLVADFVERRVERERRKVEAARIPPPAFNSRLEASNNRRRRPVNHRSGGGPDPLTRPNRQVRELQPTGTYR